MAWFEVCSIDAVPWDKPYRTVVDDLDLVVVRSSDSEYFVLENRCSHMDRPLHNGAWDAASCQLTCLYHSASFDIRQGGKAMTPPAVTPLQIFSSEIRDGKIFVSL